MVVDRLHESMHLARSDSSRGLILISLGGFRRNDSMARAKTCLRLTSSRDYPALNEQF